MAGLGYYKRGRDSEERQGNATVEKDYMKSMEADLASIGSWMEEESDCSYLALPIPRRNDG
jgi:hypothetical protein